MDFMPPDDWSPHISARLRRAVFAVIAGWIALGAATALERRTHPIVERPPGVAALPASPVGR